eukprot:XP_008672951.1 60S ribosomal protein L18A isoform X2 [Zea mays]
MSGEEADGSKPQGGGVHYGTFQGPPSYPPPRPPPSLSAHHRGDYQAVPVLERRFYCTSLVYSYLLSNPSCPVPVPTVCNLEITRQVCGDVAMIDFPVVALVLDGSCS